MLDLSNALIIQVKRKTTPERKDGEPMNSS
jgi:hypothetical protein